MREARRETIDRVSIERANGWATAYAERCAQVAGRHLAGEDRAERLAVQECAVCFRGGRQGAAAVTTRQCGLCDAGLKSGNSCIDVLCINCARENALCKHCGADIDLKTRRKPRAYETKKGVES